MLTLTQQYTILGVGPTATLKEVKTAYIRLAKQFHPDKVKEETAQTSSFVSIRNAYEAVNAELIKKHAEDQQRRRLQSMNERLNTLMNMFEGSDASSDSEDFDDYYTSRMQSIDRSCDEIQRILNRRANNSVKEPAKPGKSQAAWRDTEADTSCSSMLIEDEMSPPFFQSTPTTKFYRIMKL